RSRGPATVVRGVLFAGMSRFLISARGVPVGRMGMMGARFMLPFFVMLSGVAVVLSSLVVVFGSSGVVLRRWVLVRHTLNSLLASEGFPLQAINELRSFPFQLRRKL